MKVGLLGSGELPALLRRRVEAGWVVFYDAGYEDFAAFMGEVEDYYGAAGRSAEFECFAMPGAAFFGFLVKVRVEDREALAKILRVGCPGWDWPKDDDQRTRGWGWVVGVAAVGTGGPGFEYGVFAPLGFRRIVRGRMNGGNVRT